MGLCRACYQKHRLSTHPRAEANRAIQKRSQWTRNGIDFTVKKYRAMLDKQGGVCAICLDPPRGKWLAVDHNHHTGVIRGLLCDYCNRRLLIVRNTPDVLERAVAYLRREFSTDGEG